MKFENFQQILQHDNDKIKDMGEKAQMYHNSYENNMLSCDEYQELIEDITDTNKIKKQAENMNEKILLEQASIFIQNIFSVVY